MKIDKMMSKLDTACGMLLVASIANKEVRKAIEIVTEVSIALGDIGDE